jgi:hypothetical protein
MSLEYEDTDSALNSDLPEVLKRGRTVEAWCETLRETHGVRVAVRTMKKLARKNGHFLMCGKQMLL